MSSDILVEKEFGYCRYDINWGRNLLIYNLYIYKEFRRSGKARELLNEIISKIRSLGYFCSIYVESVPEEDSISKVDLTRFYESLGLCVLNKD